MAPWLEAAELSFAYRGEAPVIEALNLRVASTSPLAVCGRSGVGKTTLLNLLAGTLKPTKGFAAFDGRKITKPSSERALVFQNHNLFPWLTARANVEFGMRYNGLGRKACRARAVELLARFDLADAADRHPHELSGGMRQRVGIARALAVRPKCLLLDEPFAALDAATKAQIIGVLKEAISHHRMRVVVVSHDVEDVTEICGQVLMLRKGRPACLMDTGAWDRETVKERIKAEFIHSGRPANANSSEINGKVH